MHSLVSFRNSVMFALDRESILYTHIHDYTIRQCRSVVKFIDSLVSDQYMDIHMAGSCLIRLYADDIEVGSSSTELHFNLRKICFIFSEQHFYPISNYRIQLNISQCFNESNISMHFYLAVGQCVGTSLQFRAATHTDKLDPEWLCGRDARGLSVYMPRLKVTKQLENMLGLAPNNRGIIEQVYNFLARTTAISAMCSVSVTDIILQLHDILQIFYVESKYIVVDFQQSYIVLEKREDGYSRIQVNHDILDRYKLYSTMTNLTLT